MKIIQTYWSLPSSQISNLEINGRNKGGWPSEKYHAMSWALSCSKFNQFYPEVNLYTDNKGCDWLINKLGLSYSNVFNELDRLNNYNPLLWALPKVYVYAKQNYPFIHADSDVFIWENFSNAFAKSNLLVQNLEINYEYYKEPLKQISKSFKNIPPLLKAAIDNMDNEIISINAGVIGGQNVDFYTNYAKLVFEFVDSNIDCLEKVDAGNLNIVLEQLYFYLLAKEQKKTVTTLMENVSHDSSSLIRFNITPIINKYVHVLGYAKKNPVACNQLEIRLKYEFPKLYNHINSIYKKENNISVSFIKTIADNNKTVNEIFKNTNLLLQQLQINYSGLTFNEICRLVETEFEKSDQDPEYKLLTDIYQIEKYNYLLHKKISDNQKIFFDNAQVKAADCIDKLYKLDVFQFLQIKFTLDTEVCSIAYLSYEFPQNITTEIIESIATKKCRITECNETRMLLIQAGPDVKQIYTKLLTDWNTLLYYFDGETLSGTQLITMIKTKQADFEYSGNDIETDILNFLTSNCIYFPFLKMIK